MHARCAAAPPRALSTCRTRPPSSCRSCTSTGRRAQRGRRGCCTQVRAEHRGHNQLCGMKQTGVGGHVCCKDVQGMMGRGWGLTNVTAYLSGMFTWSAALASNKPPPVDRRLLCCRCRRPRPAASLRPRSGAPAAQGGRSGGGGRCQVCRKQYKQYSQLLVGCCWHDQKQRTQAVGQDRGVCVREQCACAACALHLAAHRRRSLRAAYPVVACVLTRPGPLLLTCWLGPAV